MKDHEKTAPTSELVFDYYESLADASHILALRALDAKLAEKYNERYKENFRIMKVIRAELERRGELGRIDNA